MKVKLSEQSKVEFIEHISKQSIKCWFDGDEFIMPSGQGKVSRGIVLYQLEVWQLKQAEIDEKDKRIEDLENELKHLRDSFHKSISFEHDLFDKGWNQCAERIVEDIYRLTGIGKSARGEHE